MHKQVWTYVVWLVQREVYALVCRGLFLLLNKEITYQFNRRTC